LHSKSRVIFVDWYGVMSTARFWDSLRDQSPAPADRAGFDCALDQVFATDVVNQWMRGQLTTRQVVARFLADETDESCVGFLEHQATLDCVHAPVRGDLVAALERLRSRHWIVLATDNMDCFAAALAKRNDLQAVFDDYLVSSDLGVLKAEDPHRFFGPWLASHQVEIGDAMLIDDRMENCDRFREIGGQAILFNDSPQMWVHLKALTDAEH
jgi:FMN phosphatase YigB (HAD superfamily)